jgi:hypothetical protein
MASVSVLLVRPLVLAVGAAGAEAFWGATGLTAQLLDAPPTKPGEG